MKVTVVVDANPIISALIGGASTEVFFDRRFNFVTTEFTLNEVRKYIPVISEKSGVKSEKILVALSFLPLTTVPEGDYGQNIPEADGMIGAIDKKDTRILALALALKAPLWSEDRDFENAKGIILLKTKDLL